MPYNVICTRLLPNITPVLHPNANIIAKIIDNTIGLEKGENFGLFNYTSGSPVVISSVVEDEQYAECLMQNEEMDDPMVFEEIETKQLDEVDFGLSTSTLSVEQIKEVRLELSGSKEVFQWDGVPVSLHIRLSTG